MSEQQTQLDFTTALPREAEDRIREGMAVCDANADYRWKRWVDGCILAVAKRQQEFTVDEIIAELESLPDPPSTHNLAALGPRMKEVAKTLKYMVATDRVQRSKRPVSHGNLLRIWQSRVFETRTTSSIPKESR